MPLIKIRRENSYTIELYMTFCKVFSQITSLMRLQNPKYVNKRLFGIWDSC
jgi:hypothetical protein